VNADATGDNDVGNLAGLNRGTVRNSYSSGKTAGSDLAGSLVGGSIKTLANCHSAGNISGESRVGGLVEALTAL